MKLLQSKLTQAFDRAQHEVVERDVLRIAGQIKPKENINSFDGARTVALQWVKELSGGTLPDAAWEFQDFKTDLAGRNIECYFQDFEDVSAWAVKAEDPDDTVAGRIWKTEIIVAKQSSSIIRFSLRLRVSSHTLDHSFVPSSPRLVTELIEKTGLRIGRNECSPIPMQVNDHTSYDLFIDHLLDVKRTAPIVVSSFLAPPDGNKLNVPSLCRRLAGMAHVYSLSPKFAKCLSDEVGRELSVFDGGIRIYRPNFQKSDDPQVHRLFLKSYIRQENNKALVARQIAQDVSSFSIRRNRLGKEILAFSDFSAALHKHRSEQRANDVNANDVETYEVLVSTLRDQVESLERQVNEAKEIEAEALEENDTFRERAEDAEARARNLTAQIQHLKRATDLNEPTEPVLTEKPTNWQDFSSWVDDNFAGEIALTGAAKREIKKAQFAKIDIVCDCIEWLAKEGRVSRIDGLDGASSREAPVADGVVHAHCGGDAYDFDWQGQRHTADWHIKGSNSRDPKHCLRIYFAWDNQSQQIVISHMPSHRTTSMS